MVKVGYACEIFQIDVPVKRYLGNTMPLKLRKISVDRRMKLYHEAMRLSDEKGWGNVRISRALDIPKSTVNEWLYRGSNPVRTGHPHVPDLKPSRELCYIIGVVFGDGCVYKTKQKQRSGRIINIKRIELQVKDIDFIQEFNKCISKVLNKEKQFPISITTRGLFRISPASKFLFNFLNQDLENLKSTIEKYPGAFIRGIADSEATVNPPPRRSICFYNTNLLLLKYIHKLLIEKFTIKSTIFIAKKGGFKRGLSKIHDAKDLYGLNIATKKGLVNYWKHIGFCIVRKQMTLEKIIRGIKN